MGNIVSEDFKFIGYINQYHSEGIYFTFRIKPDTITDKNYSKAGDSTFFSPFVDNEIIEIAVIEKFYKRRWQELEPEYLELDFVESDIKLLLSFSDEIKTNYRKQFNPLLKYFKTKLIELNNPYPIIKSLVTEKPELLNFHNEVIQSFNMIHLFIKPKGGSWIDGAYIPDKEYIIKNDISSIIEKQFLKMFLEVIPNAKTEIENIIFQNGSGTERVVNKILSDLKHCQEGFDLISNNLSIIAFTQLDDIELSQRNYETLSDGEKDFHISFVKVSNLFYEYYQYFLNLTGRIPVNDIINNTDTKLNQQLLIENDSLVPERSKLNSILLAHALLAKYKEGSPISKNNAVQIATEYHFSPGSVKNKIANYEKGSGIIDEFNKKEVRGGNTIYIEQAIVVLKKHKNALLSIREAEKMLEKAKS